MKKLLALALAATLALGLAACGDDPVTMSTRTANGISIDLPSDIGEFKDQNGVKLATSEDSTSVVTVTAVSDAGGTLPGDIDQDSYVQSVFPENNSVEVVKYDNAANCNGVPAIFAVCNVTNDSGNKVVTQAYMLFYNDGTLQGVSISYSAVDETSTKANMDAILASIKKS